MNQDDLKTINLLLDGLENDKSAGMFLTPVDHVGLNLFDYLTIITKPMDISTIRKQIEEDQYSNTDEIYQDIQLIWDNCKKYNIEGSEVYKLAQNCERFVKRFLDKHNKAKAQNGKNTNDKSKKNSFKGGSNYKNNQSENNQLKEGGDIKEDSTKKEGGKGAQGINDNYQAGINGKKEFDFDIEENLEAIEPESTNGLSAYEKVTLSNRVKKLQNDGLASLVRLVQKDCPNSIKETNDIIEITLGSLDRKTYEQLDRLINTFLRVKETNQENLEQKKNKVN